jgi:rubrerythrin
MDKPAKRQYREHCNEEDRQNALRESKRKYGKKKWTCEICNITILRGNKTHHLKSQKHMRKECPTCSESED